MFFFVFFFTPMHHQITKEMRDYVLSVIRCCMRDGISSCRPASLFCRAINDWLFTRCIHLREPNENDPLIHSAHIHILPLGGSNEPDTSTASLG